MKTEVSGLSARKESAEAEVFSLEQSVDIRRAKSRSLGYRWRAAIA
jgi:hypothetical protein